MAKRESTYTANQAAERVNVSYATIWRAVHCGELPAESISLPGAAGKEKKLAYTIRESDLLAWAAHRQAEPKKPGRKPGKGKRDER